MAINSKRMVELRKQAEAAVSDMPEGVLKTKSFEVILGKLLESEWMPAHPLVVGAGPKPVLPRVADDKTGQRQKVPQSCPDRIILLREDGFFKVARTINEIRDELQIRGWTYPVTSLSGPLQRLVQKRELRRIPGGDEKKGAYTYAAP